MLETPIVQPTSKPTAAHTNGSRVASTQDGSNTVETDFDAEYAASQPEATSQDALEADQEDSDANEKSETVEEEIAEVSGEEVTASSQEDLPDFSAASSSDRVPRAQTAKTDETLTPQATKTVINVSDGADAGKTIGPQTVAPTIPDEGDAALSSRPGQPEVTAAVKPGQKPAKQQIEEVLPAGAKTVAENIFSTKALTNKPAAQHLVDQALPTGEAAQSGGGSNGSTAVTAAMAPLIQPNAPVAKRETKFEMIRASREDVLTPAQTQPAAAGAFTGSVAPIAGLTASHQQLTAQLASNGDRLELAATGKGDLDLAMPWEPRANASSNAQTVQSILTRAETPAMIGRQMADALQRSPDKPVEVSLNPRELGRVRMSISAAEAGITVSVLAERPETLDLMRRNIDQLAREFQAIGYESISFAFAEGHAQQHDQTHTDKDQAHIAVTSEDPVPDVTVSSASQKVAASGLDLRL